MVLTTIIYAQRQAKNQLTHEVQRSNKSLAAQQTSEYFTNENGLIQQLLDMHSFH